jgi:hypothetical protein
MDKFKWIKDVEIAKKLDKIPTQIKIQSPNKTVYTIETDDDGKLNTKKLPKPKTILKEI